VRWNVEIVSGRILRLLRRVHVGASEPMLEPARDTRPRDGKQRLSQNGNNVR